MHRIAITGSSGYYGRHLIGHIRKTSPRVEILGLDVAPSRGPTPDRFIAIDIRSPGVERALADFRPDTVVHLAFVLNPLHDEARMHDINVNGSRNVLSAVANTGPKRFLVASSATALGAWPDNPVPLDDRAPVRGRPEFRYSHDKVLVEKMLVDFSELHPAIAVSWVRPAIIYGPGVDNYLSALLLKFPLVVLPDGCNVPQQYVHEDDVAAATWCILEANGRGPYNIAPPDWILLTDVARETGRRAVSIPWWAVHLASQLCWTLRLPLIRMPPSMTHYVRYPFVLAPTRLCRELGFQFRYSTLETLREMLRSMGRLANDPARQSAGSPPPEVRRAG